MNKGAILSSLLAVTFAMDIGYMPFARYDNTSWLLTMCMGMGLLCAIPAMTWREWASKLPNRTKWFAVAYAAFFAGLSAFFIASDRRIFVNLLLQMIGPSSRY